MGNLTPMERLQPSLLDRLIDDQPSRDREPREARVLGRQALRAAVMRDLSWLFNATRPDIDWARAPHAERSVLNFGLPPLSGETMSTLDVGMLELAIRRSIIDFEPRIEPATIKVKASMNESVLDHHNQIELEIRGKLWAQPVPIEMLLRTVIDLESGQVDVQELN